MWRCIKVLSLPFPLYSLLSLLISKEMNMFYKTCFSGLLYVLPIQSERNERPLLSPLILLSDCWMDWSQLIWQWQGAKLLAQWPTSTKDRNHQQNSHCPQIDFGMTTKPRQSHLKPAVPHWHLVTQTVRWDHYGQHIRNRYLLPFIFQIVPRCTNDIHCSFAVSLNSDRVQVKRFKVERSLVTQRDV